MLLALNPRFRITKQKSNIILHSSRFLGKAYLQSLSPTEAIVLALYDGTRSPEDVYREMEKITSFSKDHINNVIKITQNYLNQSVLIDINTLKNKSQLRTYNPLDYVFNMDYVFDSEVKLIGTIMPDQPLGFTYLPTLSCNRSCKYCYANSIYLKKEEHIPFHRLAQIIDEAADLGICSINISGGEPFLRPDLTQILEYMLDKDIYPTVSTKTILSEDIVRRLSIAGLEDIQVSLDSPNPEIANFLVGDKNYYQEIIKTIQLFVKYGIKVNLNCVITSYNIRDLPDLLNLATELNISEVNLSPYVRSLGRNDDNLFPSLKDQQWLNSTMPNLLKEYPELKNKGILTNEQSLFSEDMLPDGISCTSGMLGFILLPNGDVSMCERVASDPTFIMGNLNNQSIMEMWSSPKWYGIRYPNKKQYDGTECFRCEAFERCTVLRRRCFVSSKIVYSTIYGPAPNCPRIQTPHLRMA